MSTAQLLTNASCKTAFAFQYRGRRALIRVEVGGDPGTGGGGNQDGYDLVVLPRRQGRPPRESHQPSLEPRGAPLPLSLPTVNKSDGSNVAGTCVVMCVCNVCCMCVVTCVFMCVVMCVMCVMCVVTCVVMCVICVTCECDFMLCDGVHACVQ